MCCVCLFVLRRSGLGGFGQRPKFPRPVNLNLFAQYAQQRRSGSEAGAAAANGDLHAGPYGRGGMHDHLGGGFHRYSVDDHWIISRTLHSFRLLVVVLSVVLRALFG